MQIELSYRKVIMKEEFKTIDYKGLSITVSNYGKIILNGKEKRIYYNADGYSVCSLNIPNVGHRSVAVHRLVALAFIPNIKNLPEVNHKDYNRKNARADNLEWITHADNIRYSNCNRPDMNGINNPNYGNKTLSIKYKKDKEMSREKQGRKGLKNGRCQKIDVYYDDKYLISFDYMIPCCQYFIDNGYTNSKNIESIRSQINKHIKNNKYYKKHFKFIKR